jgi:Zn-dependent protease/CBS domain-containing protein
MNWSVRIGRVKNIDIRVHVTFVFIVLFFAIQYWGMSAQGLRGALFGVIYALLLFGCVVLHELGHSLVAQRFGVKVVDITLWPIGGVARMEEMPRKPRQELVVSVSGPAVNFVIAGLLAMLGGSLLAFGGLRDVARLSQIIGQPTWQTMWLYLLGTNVALGLFNLIPAFPMDGGRVLRSLLALALPYLQATRIAVAVGQGIALMLGLAGLLIPGQLTLLLIALFIFFGAGQEGQVTAARELLGDLRVSQAASLSTRTVLASDRLSHVLDLTLSTHQADFMVLDGDRLVGVLSRSAVMEALRKHGADVLVGEVMCPEHPSVQLGDTLLTAQRLMSEAQCQALPVLEGGKPVGLLTMADINEAYALMAIAPQTFVQQQPVEPHRRANGRRDQGQPV